MSIKTDVVDISAEDDWDEDMWGEDANEAPVASCDLSNPDICESCQ